MTQVKQYSSLEELAAEYRRLREQADDPIQKAELLAAEAEAKVVFNQQAAENRLIDAWKKLAMQDYPLAAKFPQLISGNTEEEIMESAKETHEQLASLTQGNTSTFDQFRDSVVNRDQQNPYGRAGVLGGGSQPGSQYTPPEQQTERWQRQFAQQFNDAPRDAYGQRVGISPRDVDRYAQQRFTDHIKDQVGFWAELTNSSYRGRRR